MWCWWLERYQIDSLDLIWFALKFSEWDYEQLRYLKNAQESCDLVAQTFGQLGLVWKRLWIARIWSWGWHGVSNIRYHRPRPSYYLKDRRNQVRIPIVFPPWFQKPVILFCHFLRRWRHWCVHSEVVRRERISSLESVVKISCFGDCVRTVRKLV